MTKTFIAKIIAGMSVFACVGAAMAQTSNQNQYPNKPVRVVSPGPGGLDVIARKFMAIMEKHLGQRMIMENKPSGVIPGNTVAMAPPDGYTVLFSGGPQWLAPLTQKDVPYDPVKDFAPVAMIYFQPYMLLVSTQLQVNSVKELIALAKQRPGQINMGSGSPGSSGSIAGTLFREMADINLTVIPYKSGTDRATALLSGQITVDFLGASDYKTFLNSGKVKAIAITSKRPSPQFPGIPAVADNVPDFEYGSTALMFAPAKTPAAIINRLNQDVNKTLKEPETIKMLTEFGADPTGGSSQVAADFVKWDMARMDKLLKSVGVTPQ